MMGDGKALQMGTSHELGQNFAKAFDITFQSSAGASEHAWQTSWGVSTRLIGALIMGHGDDAGLRVPPALAPIQAVVVLVRDEEGAGERAATLAAELAGSGVRVRYDDRVDTGFGRRAVEWELKGVPVRVEVGPRDLAAGTVTLVRRDVAGEKATVPLEGLGHRVRDMLAEIQSSLHQQALDWREAGTADAGDLPEARDAAQKGFARVPWDVIRDAETDLAADALTVRCLQTADGGIPASSAEPGLIATVAKAY
jgi:prolyl-tRNA synthetase